MSTSGMARFREAWSDTTLSTASPNGCVELVNHADREIRFAIDDPWFRRTDLAGLVEQVTQSMRLAFVERTRAYNRRKEEHTGIRVEPMRAEGNPHVETFIEKRDSLVVDGTSAGGEVHVVCVGMRRFTVTVDSGLWNSGDRIGLETALGEAATEALHRQFEAMVELKREGH